MAVIDSLVAKLSFDFDDKALKKFDEGMKSAAKIVAVVATGAAVAGAAIFAFTSKIAAQNDELGKLAQRIGITSQVINELGFVAQLNGGSVNVMSSSLENLAKTASETARGLGAGVEAFGILGVSTTDANGKLKQTDQLLLDVADAISTLDSQSQKLELLNKLGIDSSLLLTIEQGSAAIRAQRKEVEELGFVLDKDATVAAANFNDEMLRVNTIVKGIASSIGTKLMKQITPMIKVFLEWFKVNKNIIRLRLGEFFEKLTKVLRIFFNIGLRVAAVAKQIIKSFGGWRNITLALVVGMLLLNESMFGLFTSIGKVAIAFLVFEDLIKFAKGADSQIGALAEKFPIIGTAAESLIDIFKLVREGWGLIFTDGEAALEGLMILIDRLANKLSTLPVIEQLIAGGKGLRDLGNMLSGFGDAGVKTNIAPAFIGNIVAPPAGTTVNDVTINIDGGDIRQVKQAVSEALGAEFKATELNMSTSIRF